MLRHYEPIPHHKRMKILRGPSSETRRGVFDEAIQFLKQKTHLRQGYGVAKLSLRQGYGVARQDSGLPRMITSSQRRALQGSRQKGTDPLILASPSPLPPSLRGVFDEAIQKEQKTHLRQDSGVAKLSRRQGYGGPPKRFARRRHAATTTARTEAASMRCTA